MADPSAKSLARLTDELSPGEAEALALRLLRRARAGTVPARAVRIRCTGGGPLTVVDSTGAAHGVKRGAQLELDPAGVAHTALDGERPRAKAVLLVEVRAGDGPASGALDAGGLLANAARWGTPLPVLRRDGAWTEAGGAPSRFDLDAGESIVLAAVGATHDVEVEAIFRDFVRGLRPPDGA